MKPLLFALFCFLFTFPLLAADRPPNVVIIFNDDMAYGDIGCFGAEGYETPHIDQLANTGRRFTNFYVSQAVCSASRTSLLTGCYNVRLGILGALGPGAKIGISEEEMTLGELVKQQGYATAAIGKWHLGHHEKFLPMQHGFDEYYGLPYSNDMWPSHPTMKSFPALPLIEGNQIVDADVTGDDQTHLTTDYTNKATDFIERNHEKPFLLYLAHSMPHVPLFVSDKFKGHSKRGLFGDVIEEIDWSVGQVIGKLKQHNLIENTLVIFTSDNGPWLLYGDHAGSAKPLREGKGTMWDGGCRVPCVMSWPGKIPAGTSCDELAATIDILPTIARLTGAQLPAHKIDGLDISSLMFDDGAKTPHESYLMYYGEGLHAIRSGDWKLHFPHGYISIVTPGKDGLPGKQVNRQTGVELYNLKDDVSESTDVSKDHPEIVERLTKLADAARVDLGDSFQKINGSGRRKVGSIQ
jgi:arylsulfatase A